MPNSYSWGDIEVNAPERILRINGHVVPLSGRAFDLLVVLLKRGGRLVSKDELLQAVWGDAIVEEANLHVHVSALRKLLGPGVIATVPGRGYRLTVGHGMTATSPPAVAPVALGSSAAILFGRAQHLNALHGQLANHALVTITGAGGIGKTRLALAALSEAAGRHADGVATVDLASITDPALIAVTIITALKLPSGGAADALPALLLAVRDLDALVLLDNAEYLAVPLAPIASALVRAAPNLRLMVTSQVPLRVDGEWVFRLSGLDVPSAHSEISAAEALRFGAVALFNERLQAADRRLRVDDSNLAAVLEICRGVDGLALALELAAARCPVLGVRGVAERLHERLRLLRFDNPTAPTRQQTLGATIAFSESLLSATQRHAFRQLSVFTGSFTLQMGLSVMDLPALDEIDRIDLLSELVDRSLVTVDAAEHPRYRLLESGRLYGLSRLGESADGEQLKAARRLHAQALRQHLDAAWKASWWLTEDEFVAQYECDLDNLRTALETAMAHDGPTAIALAGSATRLWRRLSLHHEALRQCQAAVALIDAHTPAELEARLWEGMAQLYAEVSSAQARPAARRAADLCAELGDAQGRYLALAHIAFSYCGHNRVAPQAEAAFAEMQQLEDPAWPPSVRLYGRKIEAGIASDAGQLEHSRSLTRARLELATACGSQRDVNAALGNLADLALMSGDADEAVRLGRSLLVRLRRRDAATRAIAQSNLLHALLAQGEAETHDKSARALASDMLETLRQMDFLLQVSAADALALLAAREGRWRAAAMLLGYSDASYAADGQARELNEERAHQAARALVAAHTAQPDFAARAVAWQSEGAALPAPRAMALGLELPVGRSAAYVV